MKIKAQGLLNGATWILERHGEAALASVLSMAGSEVRERYMTAIAIEWHDAAELELFLKAAESVLGGSEGAVAKRIGAAGAQRNMGGFLRRLGFYISRRDYALARVASAWRQFNDAGEMVLGEFGPSSGTLEVRDAQPPGPLFCATLTGWCETLGTHVGMDAPSALHTRCVIRGHPVCQWRIRWSRRGTGGTKPDLR